MLEHVERFIGQGSDEFQHLGRESCVAAQRLDLRQVLHCTLSALARKLKPVVLVNPRGALGLDAESANQAQPFDQLGKVARRSGISGLPQPRQRALSAPGADFKQLIELIGAADRSVRR